MLPRLGAHTRAAVSSGERGWRDGVVRWGGSRRSGSNSKQGKSARTQADTHTHRHTQTQRQTHTDTETDTQTHGHTDRHRHTQTQTHTFARYVRPRETWCTSVSCS